MERRKFRTDIELPLSASSDVQDAIIGFLKSSSDESGGIPQPENLELTQNVTTPTRKIIRYQQSQDKIPILDSYVVTQLDKEGKVKQVDLGVTSKTDIVKPLAAGDTKITPQEAINYASSAIGDSKLREKVNEPEIVYYPTRTGLRLAYKVLILTREPMHDWRIIVDAYTREVLEQRDLLFEVDGQGKVFDPNPVVTANDNSYRDPDAIATCGFVGTPRATIDAQRVDRVLKDITFSGGTHKLEGPYVKLRDFGAPNIPPPEEVGATNFNYSSGDDKFEAVMTTTT